MKETEKLFSNTVSRARLSRAQDEAVRIRRRIDRLDASLVGELTTRMRDLDAALIHVREIVTALTSTRSMRGR